jgi:hypothetical protein
VDFSVYLVELSGLVARMAELCRQELKSLWRDPLILVSLQTQRLINAVTGN